MIPGLPPVRTRSSLRGHHVVLPDEVQATRVTSRSATHATSQAGTSFTRVLTVLSRAAVLSALMSSVFACGDSSTSAEASSATFCTPASTSPCFCADGTAARATCSLAGDSYSACGPCNGATASCSASVIPGTCTDSTAVSCGGGTCCAASHPYYCSKTNYCYASESAATLACGGTSCASCVTPKPAAATCTAPVAGTCSSGLSCGGGVCCGTANPYYCPKSKLCYTTAEGAKAACGTSATCSKCVTPVDPCHECLSSCRGLSGCCTGCGCICQSACGGWC